KAELVGTLYDMYDRYDFWLDGALEAGDSAAVVAERNRVAGRMSTLEEELQVPTVSTATVITVNQGYMAQELMITSGSHPRTPYEYLYNSAPGGSVNFAWGLFLMQSSGRERFVTRYSLIPSLNTTSEERTFRAGVRAGAGYVGLGRASYTTSYAEGPNYSSATLSTDNSPPTTPEVEVKVGPDWVDSDVTNAWTADATQLDVRWDAADSHSGIGEYEYAIGTGAQRTSIRDWTSAGGRTEMSIYGLDLVPNAANYVYVRARNGSGTWGGVGRSAPVLYDPTPPTFDPGAALIDAANVQIDEGPASDPFALNGLQPESSTTDTGDGATGEAEAMQWPTSACEVTSPSRGSAWYAGMSGTQAGGTRVVPEDLTLLIPPARDDGSGIQRYYYRVTDGAPAGPFRDGDGWTAVTGGSAVTVAGEDLDYRDGTYVSVVAMNRAGLVSEPLVAVHQPQDPTPPAGLDFCVGQDAEPGRLALKFASPARDRESGIRGYQYRVRSASGGVIRDWSPTDSVDFSGIGTGDVFRTPDLGVGDGAGVSVDVRVSNHQGQWQWVSSGPLAVDYSAPPRPSGDVLEVVGYGESQTDQSYGGLFRLPQSTSTLPIALRVQITAPDDPESGLAYQQWAVLPASEAGTRDPFAGIVQEEKTGVWLLPGFGSSDPASAMGGIIGGARAGTYMTELRASGLDALHDAAPGTEYRLYLRTVNTRGVVSQQYEVRFHLPKSDQGTVAEENGR
ncbi:MAG TPA: hypothetical protein VK966_10280, partial [Longimicrobiales bacterium]|nr:hypothetical protein [Longimicrobiales bacterium]